MASNVYVNIIKVILCFSISITINLTSATNCKGCVQLDSYCFDKIVSKFEASLVKFDVAYPYGEKHEEFSKVSESVRDVTQLLVAEVGVKDYGEKDNADLASRYGVTKDDLPVVLLFKPNAKPITFNGEFIASKILNFVQINSKVYVGLPGCIEEFDKLAAEFSTASTEIEKKKILRKTEDQWDGVKGASNQKSAEVYVKTMRHAVDKPNFVYGEIKRIANVMKGKLSSEKSNEMQIRLNILQSFVAAKEKRDEL